MPGSGSGGSFQPSSQGSSVSFAGSDIGRLTGWRITPGSAEFEDVTSSDSVTLGSGADTRVVKDYDCLTVEPGSADVTLFGCPPHIAADIGSRGTLAVTFDGGSLSFDAYLESYEVTAAVGEVLVGSARFRFSGSSGF